MEEEGYWNDISEDEIIEQWNENLFIDQPSDFPVEQPNESEYYDTVGADEGFYEEEEDYQYG